MTLDRHLSVAAVAEILGVDPRTVRADIAARRLPAKRIGRRGVLRIDPADLAKLEVPGERSQGSRDARGRRPRPSREFARFAREVGTLASEDGSTGANG
jgi:hypothetical protein